MKKHSGFSMIEVMVSLVILSIGLLGLAALHARGIASQAEAFQRSQALVLAKDMAERIVSNRAVASASSDYRVDPGEGDTPRGKGYNSSQPQDCSALTGAAKDLCEWHNNLLGTSTAGSSTALTGARGCVYELGTSLPKTIVVSVAWQGYSSTVAPAVDCGSGLYGADDTKRKAITLTVTFPLLD